MRGYGQFCPVAKGAEVFAERWTPLVLRELLCGSTHFSDLHRGVPLMSRTLLSTRLKQLEEIGVVKRKLGARGPEYHLTEAGREFAPIVATSRRMGTAVVSQQIRQRRARRHAADVGHAPHRKAGRFSVRANLRGIRIFPISLHRNVSGGWSAITGMSISVQPTPGSKLSCFVTTDLRTMCRVWLGDLAVRGAVSSGQIELDGSRELRQRFERWLGLSGFAGIKGAKQAA